MRGGRPTALAISLAAVGLALTLAGLVLVSAGAAANGTLGLDPNAFGGIVLGATYPIVGALVAARRPGNPIGWIYLVIGLSQATNVFAAPYAAYGLLTAPGSLPFADVMSWLSLWTWAPGLVLFTTISLLIFPDGHHLSLRWRLVTVASIGAMVLIIVPMAVVAWPLRGIELVRVNAGGSDDSVSAALPLQSAGLAIWALASVAALAALVVRWRRSRGIEREQLKWLTFAVAVAIPTLVVSLLLPDLGWLAAFSIGLASLIPIAIAIAILRYRLYDIDRIINRTLVYVPMTAILAGIYTASVALTQRVFVAVTGQKSDGAIVFTTLVVVILFTPVKNALQATVDRRFKEVADPTAPLAQLAALFDTRVWPPDPIPSLRRLLDVSIGAFGSTGGSVSLAGIPIAQSGDGAVEAPMNAAAGQGPARIAVAIGPRPGGRPYTDDDHLALEAAVEAVARALTSLQPGS